MTPVGNSSISMSHLSAVNVAKEDSEMSSRPVGSMKKIVRKVTSKGLIELPPEPGTVKFECQGISRPSSGTAVRGGSAGRVERSLQLARKEELVDEIPTRCNSAGAEMIFLGKIKHSKQLQEMENVPRQTSKVSNEEDNSDSDSSSLSSSKEIQEGKDHRTADQIKNMELPDELKAEFLTTVMDENYEKAKELCQKILLLEPDNKLCSEFHAVIVEKIQQDAVAAEDSDDDDDEIDEKDNNCVESSDSNDDGEDSNDSDSDEDEDDDEESDSDDEESDSDDEYSTPAGPVNLIMGGLPIKLQSR